MFILLILLFLLILIFINIYPLLFYKPPITELTFKKYDTIIILGYPALKDGRPSPIMLERVYKAVELFKSGYSFYIICSGGSAHNEHCEATVMANLAIANGVPTEAIIIEDKSLNTYSNIFNCYEIMKKRNWRSALVVTSPWHLKRSSFLLSKFDIIFSLKGSAIPKQFSKFDILLIYLFENYTMTKNKIFFH